MGKAIAADINLSSQGDETNSKNVKFDVYLDEADRNVKEKTVDMNSGDVKLFVSASVQGGGYLNNAQVELINTNFKLKNNPEVTKFKLDSIQSEKGVAAGLPIVAKKDESYNLSLLDMQSQIRLTGEYIDDKGNVTDINTTKAVKISWTSDELTDEDIELNEQVITNKIYSIDGVNKRVVQVLVSSKVKENKAPVKSSAIEIANPEIGVNPEEVKVAGYTTKATNGKASLDFANGENSAWEYKAEEGKTYINVLNNAVEENVVAWAKSAEDKFVVTYIYDEAAVVAPFISNVKNIVDVYGRTNGTIEKVAELKLEELADVGDITKAESNVTKNIYKGKMYIGEDTSFETRSSVYVPYSKLANTITVQDLGDKVLAGEDEVAEGIDTYYKTTKINKAEALKILGTEGTIKVYNADDKTAPIKEIVLSEEIEEDYYTISYEENVNKIAIEMSAAKAEGTMGIINEKAIKVLNEDIAKTLTELKTNTNLSVADANGTAIVNSSVESVAKLLEPSTAFNMSLDKKSLSALAENDVRITTELKAKDESNKLYKNPVINIELPKEVKEASIVNITPVVGSDELTVKLHNVITNEAGNKVIVVELQGEQTKYSANAANIVIDVKMKTDAFMANKDVEIKSTCINDGETISKAEAIKITSKAGLVTKSTIKVGENVVEKINENNMNVNAKGNEEVEVTTIMMNNYGDKLTDLSIIGNVPNGGSLKSVTPDIKDAVVYYSEETNPSVSSESWKTEVTSLDNIKSFKIVTSEEVAQGTTMVLSYKYALNAEVVDAQTSTIKVSGMVAGETVEDTLTYVVNSPETIKPQETKLGSTTNAEKLSVQTVVTAGGEEVADGAEINNGQVLRYKVKVTNTSSEALNNVKLTATIQNGVFYDLMQCGAIEDFSKDENGSLIYPEGKPVYSYDENKDMKNKEFTIEKLEAGRTSEFEYQVVVYIGNEENGNQFKNNILITANDIENISLDDTKILKEASISLKLKYGYNEEVNAYSKSKTDIRVEVKNLLNKELHNINITMNLPENIDCDENYQIFLKDDENVTLTKNGRQINLLIKKLNAGETQYKIVEFITNSIDLDKTSEDLDLKANGTVEGDTKTYVSNDYIRKILQSETRIIANLTSDKMDKTLNDGDVIVYTLNIKNDGCINSNLSINDFLQKELKIIDIKLVNINGQEENISYEAYDDDGIDWIHILKQLNSKESIKLNIKAKVDLSSSEVDSISNKISILAGENTKVETEELVNKVNNVNAEDPEQPGTNDNKKEENIISGLAWIDENKDGIRDNNEKALEAVEVLLLDKDGKEVAKTTTSLTGTYKFDKVAEGEYTVVFAYDTSKYAVTKYQVSGATESTNSDAISKQIEINGETKTVGATDKIKIDGKTINKDIDIGLIENAKFDLSLNKYITKVVLTNSSGTTTYEYEETNFAKVEISARKIAGTTMVVEYELQITNEGDVDSYVGDVIDYLPDGLVFTSETNKDWYMDGNGVLHNKTIVEQVIKPGETKSVTLVLTKSLKSDSTGTIENIGEIGVSSNKQGITEYDSIAGNKKAGEDDMSTASLIVSISTGSPMMYIGIVIGTMVVLGLGIYIINKKVLKERI